MKNILLFLAITIMLSSFVLSFDVDPRANITLRDRYSINSGVSANFVTYYGDGSQLTGISGFGNDSWNQSLANTLYSDIQWDYNQTIPAMTYTDTVNNSQSSWINTIFLKIADMFSQLQIVNMISGNLTEAKDYTNTVITGNESSWLSTYNATYADHIQDNESWNESLANTLYADISLETNNNSWNQTGADLLYSDIQWDYNQTIPSMIYTDEVNTSQSSWINSVFLKIVDMFTKNEISTMIEQNLTEAMTYTDTEIDLINTTTNIENLGFVQGSHTVDTGNASWNQTGADTIYVPYDGATGAVDLGTNTFTVGARGLFYRTDSDGAMTIGRLDATPTSGDDIGSIEFSTGTTLGGFGSVAQITAFYKGVDKGSIRFRTKDGTMKNRMYISEEGDVGIATELPTQKLDVNGSINVSGFYYGDGSQLTGVVGSGDFSFTDFQGSFDNNWSDLDYDKWMYNQTEDVDQTYVEALGFVTDVHTIIWNTLFNNTFTDLFNNLFSGKSTDDLTEGAVNKYEDGNTYNQTYDAKNSSRWELVNGNISYNNGNVGIGNDAPTAKLEINDSTTNVTDIIFKASSGIANVTTELYARGTQRWDFSNGVGEYKGSIQYSTPGDNPGIIFRGVGDVGRTDIGMDTQTGGFEIGTGNGTGNPPTQFLVETNNDVSVPLGNFSVNVGRVGIGTTSPSARLEVIGRTNIYRNTFHGEIYIGNNNNITDDNLGGYLYLGKFGAPQGSGKSVGAIYFETKTNDSSTHIAAVQANIVQGNTTRLLTTGNIDISTKPSGVLDPISRIRIDENGNIGFGGIITDFNFTGADMILNNSDLNLTTGFYLGDGSKLTGITGGNASWNQSIANELYAPIIWGYNQTLGVDQTYVEGLGFVTGVHTIIWNALFNSTLTDFVTTWFGTKTTDDLSEGSTNLYDNQTWNQTRANTLYADISIDGTVTSVSAGDGLDFSTITSTGSVTMGTPSSLTAGTSNALTSTSHTHEVSGFLETLVDDPSPQLNGYLDTNTNNIGSTTDEIENIYVATNSVIFFGNGQEVSMKYNGTDFVIQVS